MYDLVIGITAITCYTLAAIFQSRRSLIAALSAVILGLALHGLFVYAQLFSQPGLDLSFFNSLTLFAWLITLFAVAISLRSVTSRIQVILLPISIITIILVLAVPIEPHYTKVNSPQMGIHIVLSILAYGVLSMGAVYAILLGIQDSQLRHHKLSSFTQSLPSLQTTETLLFQLLHLGFALLTLALISGFIYTEQFFTHKIIFSTFAWLVFAGLLLGRHLAGWRGRKAIHWTLIGISALLLAYFGSKLVFELILKR